MSREKDLAKNTVILGIGNFLPKIFALITIPIITAKLTKVEYGTYDYIATLISLLLPVATLQIQSAAFRFLIDYRGDVKNTNKIISSILAFTIFVSTFVVVFLFIIMGNYSFITRIIICSYFMVDIINLTLGQVVRGLSMNKEYSISSIIVSITNAICIFSLLGFINTGLNGVLVSITLANIISIIYLFNKTGIFRRLSFTFVRFDTIKWMLSYSWPMVPNNLSNWVLKLSDRLVIIAFLGVEANAVYAVANKIPNLLSLAQTTFVMAWQENASIAAKDKDSSEYYSKMFDYVYTLIFSFTALLIAFTPIMFYLLIKGDYSEAYYQIPILFLGMYFYCLSAFQGGIYIANKKTKSVGISTIFAAVLNLLINLLLIKKIGITAGSISTLAAYLILFIYRMIDVKKIQKISFNYGRLIFLFLILCFMCYLCFQKNLACNITNFALAIVLSVVLNFNLIKGIFKRKIIKNYKVLE